MMAKKEVKNGNLQCGLEFIPKQYISQKVSHVILFVWFIPFPEGNKNEKHHHQNLLDINFFIFIIHSRKLYQTLT